MELQPLLTTFGLTLNEQEVYVLLSKTDWITVLALAQKTTIKRSSLYRILESLKKKGLIEERLDEHTTYYRLSDPENFETLVVEQEKQAQQMRAQLKILQGQFDPLQPKGLPDTQVIVHRGKRGLQAMEWKILKQQHGEVLIFGGDKWWEVVGQDFAEKKRDEYVKLGVKIREILNESEAIQPNGKATWTHNRDYVLHHFRHRQIAKDILTIDNEMYILPQSIILYSIQDHEVVGVEIDNPAYATLMRQLFELAWNQAEVIDNFGNY